MFIKCNHDKYVNLDNHNYVHSIPVDKRFAKMSGQN